MGPVGLVVLLGHVGLVVLMVLVGLVGLMHLYMSLLCYVGLVVLECQFWLFYRIQFFLSDIFIRS